VDASLSGLVVSDEEWQSAAQSLSSIVMPAQATAQYPIRKRYSYPALLAAVITAAVLLVIGLGNPLGQAIGSNPFTTQARSGSVLVLATTERERADAVARWAARYQGELAEFLGVRSGPVIVKLFADRDDYVDYGEAYVPGFHPAMEYCYSRAHRSIYAYDLDGRELENRLAHEMVHAVVHQRLPEMPLWLDEGIGELIESYQLADGGLRFRTAQSGWMRMVRRSLDVEDHAPVHLPGVAPRTFYSRRGRIWYALAYAVALKLDREGSLAAAVAGEPVVMSAQDWEHFVSDPRAWTDAGALRPAAASGERWTIPTVSRN